MTASDDRGLALGDGLFEVLLFEDGVTRHAPMHWARLAQGCETLGLPAPDWGAIATPKMTAAGRQALRVQWSAGPGADDLSRPEKLQGRMSFVVAPAPRPGPARLVTAKTVRRNEHSPAARLKTLSYLDNVLARAEAERSGGDEALMLNTAGHLACAAAANLFWITDGQVYTPALSCGVVAGVTRACLMAAHPVQEIVAGPEALRAAQAVFLTNSVWGVRDVRLLDGRTLAPHPLAADLAARLS